MILFNEKLVRKRNRAERRFRAYGILSLLAAASVLLFLVYTIVSSGYSAFFRTTLLMDVQLNAAHMDITSPYTRDVLMQGRYTSLVKTSLYARFPGVSERRERRALSKLLSPGAELVVRDYVINHPESIGATVALEVPLSSDFDQLYKEHLPRTGEHIRFSEVQLRWFDQLQEEGRLNYRFNTQFLFGGDSRYPELAGIGGAVVGSFYALSVCFLLAFPLGIAAATYLEEFSGNTRLTRIIEANINNLAAVPSVIFGLLGLAIFLNVFGLPRSTPLVGGFVLSLMTLPTIIIATRASIRSVSPGIRQAALGMGASPVQVVFHHVLPAAMPGTLTGTIIGLAQALGETAPLLMIGMVAFIANVPATPLDASAALPVQIFLWAESAERGFVEKTSAAMMVIMAFLILMNILAVIVRSKTQAKVE
ncbi:MAG: phosphate ABC transporter permease PstA [Gammaproteobacteria bacterium]|nr:phosphate ABC transporter permease PstA [Gammaproteobacteria bacterium]